MQKSTVLRLRFRLLARNPHGERGTASIASPFSITLLTSIHPLKQLSPTNTTLPTGCLRHPPRRLPPRP